MTILAVPAVGLSLTGAPDMDIGLAKPKQKPSQAFCVDLPIALVEELRKYATGKPNGVQLACGRSPSLKFGGRSIDLCSTPQSFRQELYRSSSAEGNSKLNYAAIMSHKLQVQKVEGATKGVGAALLALQNNMAALEKEKKSNTTIFAKDRSALGVTAKSGKIQYNSGRLPSNGSHRSMPTSPSLAASKASVRPPTSVPQDQHTMRVQAVRKVLIHLLAIKPLSEAALVQRTKARSQEVVEILEKCAERIESNTKWQLDKRSYRELDVWKFAYPTREDRQAAIDHAAAAFDRLRLSREDKLWQLLLPQKERGKGVVLSKLHLHNGPIARSSTPTIRVQGTKGSGSESEAKRRKASESESDRRVRGPSPGVRKDSGSDRSPSSAAMKQKKKVNDRGTPSTRLLPPKGTKSSTKATEKAKPSHAPPASTKSDRGGAKVKSAEYIDDSDEDASMADVAETKPQSQSDARTLLKATKSKVTKSGQQYHKITKPAPGGSPGSVLQGVKLGRVTKAVAGASADRVGSRAAEASVEKYRAALEQAAADAGLDVKASKISKSSPRSKAAASTKESSTSKITSGPNRPTSKPSPLGSSPPTNASELDSEAVNDSSTSSSSTPLISQVRSRPRSNTPRATLASKAVGASSTARPVNGLKRKAEENTTDRRATTVSNKRHQVPTSGGGGSSSSITSPPPSSATSATNSVTSQPSSRQNSSSASPVTSYHVLQLARKFKEHYAGYKKLYRELLVMADPPREKVERVKEMHAKLEGMKFEISRSAAS